MYKAIDKKEVEDLLYEYAPVAPSSYNDVGLGILLDYYRFNSAWQITVEELEEDLKAQFESEELPPLPDGCKATVIVEMSRSYNFNIMTDVFTWARFKIASDSLFRFVPVSYPLELPFAVRVTFIYHASERRRHHCDSLLIKSHMKRNNDTRIAKILDKELERNRQKGALIAQDPETIGSLIENHHLLWSEITNSTVSVQEVIDDLALKLGVESNANDVSCLLMFLEVDKQFTTMGEIEQLKAELSEMITKKVDLVVNIRLTDSHIKYITCRLVLVGDPPYIKGEVYRHFGQYEILLYEDENKECGHMLVASYYGDTRRFYLSRYDWGKFEYNHSGHTDDTHYFDEANTSKLFDALHVKKPDALLRTLRRRFAGNNAFMADSRILEFCRENGIEYYSDYHY